jgi:uncharacterized protein YegL
MVKQEVVIIVDKSGSMYGKEPDTIGGINTMINTLKESMNMNKNGNVNGIKNKKGIGKRKRRESGIKTESESEPEFIRLSIKFFDHEESIKLNRLDINEVQNLEVSDLAPRGSTALYDAIGKTIKHFQENKSNYDYDICNIYVSTDGYENASIEYDSEKLKQLIESADYQNIKMFYLGANQDAILEAEKIGIPSSQAINFAENNLSIESVYRSAAQSASRSRTGEHCGFTEVERCMSAKY